MTGVRRTLQHTRVWLGHETSCRMLMLVSEGPIHPSEPLP